MKRACVTGCSGQDGSYLCELLLDEGYEVWGSLRRSSSFNTGRINHIFDRLNLRYADLTDASSIENLLIEARPDEIYNLGAQSHVLTSFSIPEYTADATAIGVLHMLNAMRQHCPEARFYQASSSEMFGSAAPPQNELTAFHPRSPYGVAKVYAHNLAVNYRESYGMHISCGILFNHETVASFMPMFVKCAGEKDFDIKPISEIASFDESIKTYQQKKMTGIQVWGKNGWVDVTYASAYPHNALENNKNPRYINSRNGAYMATDNHVVFLEGGKEKETKNLKKGDCTESIALPSETPCYSIGEDEAELIGLLVGDGSTTKSKRGIGIHGKFTNSSPVYRKHFDDLWRNVTGGTTRYYPTKSGFNPKKIVGQLSLVGGNDWLRSLDMYTSSRHKRIPKSILNASKSAQSSFLKGYNSADGLKKNECTYLFKNFKTNSATLAMGLWYLIERTTKQTMNLTIEQKKDGRLFYSINLLSPRVSNIEKARVVKELYVGKTGSRKASIAAGVSRKFARMVKHGHIPGIEHPLKKKGNEIKKILELPKYDGWFYDLTTSSGEFHCGIGNLHVHNSPRRGDTFVTKKIVNGVVAIHQGLQGTLTLGNLDAKRDWGYAPEYVAGMYRMLQQDKPDDYVLATGETHTVREFCQEAFSYLGMNYLDYVQIDPKYYRPAEVDVLQGDASKAKRILGWEPKVKFSELVKIMVEAELHGENKT
jgi:GDPmannose 4,6-dehydratase